MFNNNLPSVSTIRKWYSTINGKPGFSSEAFTALRCKAMEANRDGKEILVCLVYDEMAIRKQEEYDQHTDTKIGFVNYGTSCVDSNNNAYAKEALVFLVTGINEKFKIPVAYFLIAGINATEKAALLQQVILMIGKSGVKVVGMSYDGLATNIAAARALGADFKNNKPYFTNHSDDNVFLFPDACHSLKTVRNRLASKGILFDDKNDAIKWQYIVELEKYQCEHKVNLGNKLTKVHIQWQKKKMSVRIAAETLSNSVADSIELLQKSGIKEFQGSEPTVAFVRRINNIFDILNSKDSKDAICFKRPISPETKDEYFKYFDESTEYISKLKLSLQGNSILRSKSKIAFFSLIVIMENFRSFYERYVESGILEKVATFHFSQDHLELLFSCNYKLFTFAIILLKLLTFSYIKFILQSRYSSDVRLQR